MPAAFTLRQRVRMSAEGRAHLKPERSQSHRNRVTTGTVVGLSGDCVQVLPDGLEKSYTYAARFWEPA